MHVHEVKKGWMGLSLVLPKGLNTILASLSVS
jgi:hypothetical protein